ncbi:MAG: T9SS type A sorting domain-containing protein [Bacteroidales bacterium]|nr:T9SS type A sorting domain-containing protein [Bacteroidales bacterium]
MKKVSMTIVFFCATLAAWGQTAVTAAGGSAEGGGYELTFSVGQVASSVSADGQLREGVVQPIVVEAVGVGDAADDGVALTVFPNPTTSGVTVRMSPNADEPTTCRLYDISGRLLATYAAGGGDTAVDLSAMPAGVYVMHVGTWTYRITKR